jgi:hypothetical protein
MMREAGHGRFVTGARFVTAIAIIFVAPFSFFSVLAEEPVLLSDISLTSTTPGATPSLSAEDPMFGDVPQTHWAWSFIEELAL